jgi:hypothetical protein
VRTWRLTLATATARLREMFPDVRFRVRVVTTLPVDVVGKWTESPGGLHTIQIHADISNDMKIETLLHEFAHAVAGGHYEGREVSHGAHWGAAYSRVYATFMRETTDEADHLVSS